MGTTAIVTFVERDFCDFDKFSIGIVLKQTKLSRMSDFFSNIKNGMKDLSFEEMFPLALIVCVVLLLFAIVMLIVDKCILKANILMPVRFPGNVALDAQRLYVMDERNGRLNEDASMKTNKHRRQSSSISDPLNTAFLADDLNLEDLV